MGSDMKLQDLRSALHKEPFTPLRLNISGGRTLEIRHPELCVAGVTAAFFGIPALGTEGEPAFERYIIVDLDHIISLEPLEAATMRGNGQ